MITHGRFIHSPSNSLSDLSSHFTWFVVFLERNTSSIIWPSVCYRWYWVCHLYYIIYYHSGFFFFHFVPFFYSLRILHSTNRKIITPVPYKVTLLRKVIADFSLFPRPVARPLFVRSVSLPVHVSPSPGPYRLLVTPTVLRFYFTWSLSRPRHSNLFVVHKFCPCLVCPVSLLKLVHFYGVNRRRNSYLYIHKRQHTVILLRRYWLERIVWYTCKRSLKDLVCVSLSSLTPQIISRGTEPTFVSVRVVKWPRRTMMCMGGCGLIVGEIKDG